MKHSVPCFRNIPVAKKFIDKRVEGGGEFQGFLSKFFCLTVPKNSVGESFTVAIISGIEKFWIRGGGSIKFFRGKFFCITVPKVSVGETFSVALISGIENFWIREGVGSIKIFSRKFFVSQCQKFP